MSKSYRDTYAGWGEYRKERSRLKDFDNWKQEALEELEVYNDGKVFVIVNEWTDIANNTSSEIVEARWFRTETDAWAHLSRLAAASDFELPLDENSFTLEAGHGLQSDEYRIEELTHG